MLERSRERGRSEMSIIARTRRAVLAYIFKLKGQLLFRPRKSRKIFLLNLLIVVLITVLSIANFTFLQPVFIEGFRTSGPSIPIAFTPKVNLSDPKVACKMLMKEIFGVQPYFSARKGGENVTHNRMYACAKKLINLEWQEDVEKAEKFRRCLSRRVSLPQESLVLTRKNTGLRANIPVIDSSKNTTKLGTRLYYGLPMDPPFKKKYYPTCSIVGNGGILRNSSCGTDIDDSHFVIRFNAPMIQPYTKDAGSKSSLTTFDPLGVIHYRYNSFKDDSDKTRFLKDVTRYKGYIFFPFTSQLSIITGEPGVLLLHGASKYIGLHSVSPIAGNPKHFLEVQKFWENWAGLKINQERISTGLYFTTAAIALCRDVRLFGFWPFPFNQHGKSLPFHYTNDVKWPRNDPTKIIHNLEKEFCALTKLHISGIIHLQLDKCKHQSSSAG